MVGHHTGVQSAREKNDCEMLTFFSLLDSGRGERGLASVRKQTIGGSWLIETVTLRSNDGGTVTHAPYPCVYALELHCIVQYSVHNAAVCVSSVL